MMEVHYPILTCFFIMEVIFYELFSFSYLPFELVDHIINRNVQVGTLRLGKKVHVIS